MNIDLAQESALLAPLAFSLASKSSLKDKVSALSSFERVQKAILEPYVRAFLSQVEGEEETVIFLSLLAINQSLILTKIGNWKSISLQLIEIEKFYAQIGGLVGYQVKVLQLLSQSDKRQKKGKKYLNPPAFDIRLKSKAVYKLTKEGIESLQEMGEIYPVGGLGDRLNLKSESGEPLPTALLPFCGRSLLEGLIRDVQAKEYLYTMLFLKQMTLPIALMTSFEKGNHGHIQKLCESKEWFFRGEENFFLFSQISVPVVTADGRWSMRGEGELNLHPGGHGAIWRMAEEKGVFAWFQEKGRKSVLIRQINNPIAGIDHGLLVLAGLGWLEGKTFGFASCKRALNAAEGVLTLSENDLGKLSIVNIEYTDFKQNGIESDTPFPTNTNILYVDLERIEKYIKAHPLPGLILNMKSEVTYFNEEGVLASMRGGRLESMMQNLTDIIESESVHHLETFLTYNERVKTISTTKRSYEEGKSLLETPAGAFADLCLNSRTLLEEACGYRVAEDVIFLYHPALGPLYEVIGQKIRKGNIAAKSELQLEIAEVSIHNFHLEGSLLITAENVLGEVVDGILRYNERKGRCKLKNVRVINQGIDFSAPNIFWKNEITRLESFEITLLGQSEFIAEDVTFSGSFKIVVPDGERWRAVQKGSSIEILKEKMVQPSWRWEYSFLEEEIILSESTSHRPSSQDRQYPQEPLLQPQRVSSP